MEQIIKKQNVFIYKTVNFFKKNYKNLLISFGGVFLVAFLGGLLVDTNSAWFNSLIKPSFYPPNFLFSFMWTILYILLAVALYLVLKQNVSKKTITLFVINGVLNVLWNLVFFSFNSAFLGVIVLVILIIFAYFLLKNLYENNYKASFYLVLPYFLWLFFAFLLNYAIYFLN